MHADYLGGAKAVAGLRRDPGVARGLRWKPGRNDPSETEEMILRQLNQNLHRMEVIPYDVLAARADAQLANLEALLGTEIVRRGNAKAEEPD